MIKALTTALVLVVPSGFSEQDRKLWLAVAYETLKDLPTDLLKRGVIHARLVADHPSKIVPAIHAEVGPVLAKRKSTLAALERELGVPPIEPERRVEGPSEPFTKEEIRAFTPTLRNMALSQGWISEAELEEALLGGEDRAGEADASPAK